MKSPSTLTVALFGEAEKGQFHTAYLCHNTAELLEYLGQPPKESLGIHYAIQALLYRRELIYFRVNEEGFSLEDYLQGLQLLKEPALSKDLSAICMPGVVDNQILNITLPLCLEHHSYFLTSESDLYDYLTQRV